MSIEDFKKSQLYSRKSVNLQRLGFDFSLDLEKQYKKIQLLLFNEYHLNNESMLTIMKKYNIPSSRTMDILFRLFDIESRTLSNANKLAIEKNRIVFQEPSRIYKEYITWDNRTVFLRSSYEEKYANELDSQKIYYEVESLKIRYYDSILQTYRFAIPDFFIPCKNKIIEIKANYWYDPSNMNDKEKEYRKLGFDFELIFYD